MYILTLAKTGEKGISHSMGEEGSEISFNLGTLLVLEGMFVRGQILINYFKMLVERIPLI